MGYTSQVTRGLHHSDCPLTTTVTHPQQAVTSIPQFFYMIYLIFMSTRVLLISLLVGTWIPVYRDAAGKRITCCTRPVTALCK